MSTPNWQRLYDMGRCKAIGVSWTEEEAFATFQLHIPADYVRDGIMTVAEYKKALAKDKEVEEKTGELPLDKQSKEALQEKAKELKVEFTPAATKDTLVKLIEKKLKK